MCSIPDDGISIPKGDKGTMNEIETREQNLFNATDTLAQFYDEIESFMDILFGSMERLGFGAKAERLRSGTFSLRNLPRRLLATATVIYVKGVGSVEDAGEDDEIDEEPEDEGSETAKAGKEEVTITDDLRIPFVSLFLFPAKMIPSVRTLTSPQLLLGALGRMRFLDKKTAQPANLDAPTLSLSNLVQIPIAPTSKEGDTVRVNCWRPKIMKKYRLEATLVGLQNHRLLELDSQEKIREIADRLAAFCPK